MKNYKLFCLGTIFLILSLGFGRVLFSDQAYYSIVTLNYGMDDLMKQESNSLRYSNQLVELTDKAIREVCYGKVDSNCNKSMEYISWATSHTSPDEQLRNVELAIDQLYDNIGDVTLMGNFSTTLNMMVFCMLLSYIILIYNLFSNFAKSRRWI